MESSAASSRTGHLDSSYRPLFVHGHLVGCRLRLVFQELQPAYSSSRLRRQICPLWSREMQVSSFPRGELDSSHLPLASDRPSPPPARKSAIPLSRNEL